MHDARVKLLQGMPIFGGIRAETLDALLAECPIVAVRCGDYFFHEDERGDCMFVLEAGRAAVLKSWHGADYPLQTLEAGDCFGEMAVMDLGPRTASVRALTDCRAIRIAAGNLHAIYARDLKQFTLIQMNMGREVCRRLRQANERLFSVSMALPEAGIENVTQVH